MTQLNKATFNASIPPIMSGIKTGGDGMRVQFDIPETDIGEGVKLVAMRGKRLWVTVEVLINSGNSVIDNGIQKRTIRKSERKTSEK